MSRPTNIEGHRETMSKTAGDFQDILPSFPKKALSDFHVESLLGGGGFSHVVLARDAAGAEWALKLIPAPGAKCLEDVDLTPLLLSEARIHLLLSNEPSVLPCVEAFKSVYADERGGGGRPATFMAVLRMPVAACSVEEWLFSVTPLHSGCQGGPQLQVDPKEVLSVWLQMVNAVHRCHVHGVVHKDIKLPNFLMDSRGKVQIMDFGLAQMEGVTPRLVVGTPWTMSPAAFKHGDDGRAGDWWSLGVVLYQLMQGGAWPFKQCWWPWQKGGGERMEAAIRRAVLAGRITFRDAAAVPESVKALIRGLLQPDPNRRWQLRQVLACEVISPELLAGVGERFPELRADMEDLRRIQSRAREVKALGWDGNAAASDAAGVASAAGPAAAAAAAGSRVSAVASNLLWRRASAVSGVAAEGGLHWPVGHRHGSRGLGGPGAADEGSYQPLLEDGQREEERAASGTRSVPAARDPAEASRANQQQQGQSDAARVEDLLLMMPDELPRAHVTPPSTPHGVAAGGAFAESGVKTVTSAGPDSMRHAATTSSLGSGGGALPGPASGRNDGVPRRDTGTTGTSGILVTSEGPNSGPGLRALATHRSTSGPQGLSPRALTYRPSPRGSRTSLHELFGMGSGHLVQPQQQQQQEPVSEGQPKRAVSGGRLGGLLLGSADLSTAGPGSPLLHRAAAGAQANKRRHSWALQWQPGSLLPSSPQLPFGADATGPGRTLGGGGGDDGQAPPLPLLLPQSSWVPPPPEVFASGKFDRRSDTSSPTRLGMAGGVGGPGAAAGPVLSPGGGVASLPAGRAGSWKASGPGLHPGASPGVRFLARARRLFTACLQRPGVRHEALDDDEYDTLAGRPQ